MRIAARQWSIRHAVGLKKLYDAGTVVVPVLRPVLRLIGREKLERVVGPVERTVKAALFDCKMCGQCALSSTGMSCPTNCAKSMRNGPCGGVRSNGNCEVLPSMPCVWVGATVGVKRLADARIPSAKARRPIDHRSLGKSSWVGVVAGDPSPELVEANEGAPMGRDRVMHGFERACRSDRFVVTVEVAPPDTADPSELLTEARRYESLVDAINITDGAGGNCHMSSVAAASVLASNGISAIHQMTCRDRNRIAIQGDLLGAAALGVRNVLCLTGDDVSGGDQPESKRVFDLDSVSLLRIASRMQAHGEFASGRKLSAAPNLFLGASTNPFVPPFTDRIANLEAKLAAGAQFIQTQFCFDLEKFETFMKEVRARDIHKRCFIIVGVGILNTAKALERMSERVPGVHVPKHIINRIAAARDQKAEGKRVLIETMDRLANVEGIAGVHVMGYRNERLLCDAIAEFGRRKRVCVA